MESPDIHGVLLQPQAAMCTWPTFCSAQSRCSRPDLSTGQVEEPAVPVARAVHLRLLAAALVATAVLEVLAELAPFPAVSQMGVVEGPVAPAVTAVPAPLTDLVAPVAPEAAADWVMAVELLARPVRVARREPKPSVIGFS